MYKSFKMWFKALRKTIRASLQVRQKQLAAPAPLLSGKALVSALARPGASFLINSVAIMCGPKTDGAPNILGGAGRGLQINSEFKHWLPHCSTLVEGELTDAPFSPKALLARPAKVPTYHTYINDAMSLCDSHFSILTYPSQEYNALTVHLNQAVASTGLSYLISSQTNLAYLKNLVAANVVVIHDVHECVTALNKSIQLFAPFINLEREHHQLLPLLTPDLWQQHGFIEPNGTPFNDNELKVLNTNDVLLCISQVEAHYLKQALGPDKPIIYFPFVPPGILLPAQPNRFRVLLPAVNHDISYSAYYYTYYHLLDELIKRVPNVEIWVSWNSQYSEMPLYFSNNQHIRFVPFVNDIVDHYKAVDCVLSPVFVGSGQPTKVMNALAHGVPVVCFDYPLQDIPIDNGVHGYKCKGQADMLDALERTLLDFEHRKAMGEQAYAAMEQLRQAYTLPLAFKRAGLSLPG